MNRIYKLCILQNFTKHRCTPNFHKILSITLFIIYRMEGQIRTGLPWPRSGDILIPIYQNANFDTQVAKVWNSAVDFADPHIDYRQKLKKQKKYSKNIEEQYYQSWNKNIFKFFKLHVRMAKMLRPYSVFEIKITFTYCNYYTVGSTGTKRITILERW